MAYVVIANAAAGAAEREAVHAAVGILGEHAPTELRWTEDADAVDGVLTEVEDAIVVVAGGDGSIHVVVERLAARGQLAEVAVGLVPLGTGNDLARGIGLPLDPAEAARVIATGTPRPLDLLVDEQGGVVLNAVHVGIGVAAAERAAPLKDLLGPAAYPAGAIAAGVTEGGWDLEITVDDEPVAAGERVLLVAICNGPCLGGGTRICPPADPADAALDVVVCTAVGRPARAAFGAALHRGTHLERDDVFHRQGRIVRVAGDDVQGNVDGEITTSLVERAYVVREGAWRLVH